jgi:hypothetical protein
MIITKADIGRKAVARNGEVWTFRGYSKPDTYPLCFSPSKGAMCFYFAENGTFDHDAESIHDLIRWADETEDAR